MRNEIEDIESYRAMLESRLRALIKDIGEVPIGRPGQLPYGWRKSAKGRTVWRILEEVISQNLEAKATSLGIHDFLPASSEVGVYDFSFKFEDSRTLYVNVKSAVRGRGASNAQRPADRGSCAQRTDACLEREIPPKLGHRVRSVERETKA